MLNPVEWLFADAHPRVLGIPFPAWTLLAVVMTLGGAAAWSNIVWLGLGMAFFPVVLEAPAMLADYWRYRS
jgi:hypothetical protein